jgi:hypothetical protein
VTGGHEPELRFQLISPAEGRDAHVLRLINRVRFSLLDLAEHELWGAP